METKSTTKPSKDDGELLSLVSKQIGPIEFLAVDAISKYERNPRKHPQKQIVKLMASISEFGIVLPILISEDGEIVAGEAVYEAACQLGLTNVPVIVATGWSKAQVNAYRLMDNRLAELGNWDEELLVKELKELIEIDDIPIGWLGWDTAEIDLLIDDATNDGDGQADDPADGAVDVPTEPVTRPGDIWHLDDHRILCGSSLDADCWDKLPGKSEPSQPWCSRTPLTTFQ